MNDNEAAWSDEEGEKDEVRCEVVRAKKNRVFQKNFMWTGEGKQTRMFLVPASRRRG